MKRKVLFFIFAVIFSLSCALLLASCASTPPPSSPPPQQGGASGSFSMNVPNEGVWLTPPDANECFGVYDPVEDGNYAIWLADYYDKDTLQVRYDDELVELTLCDVAGYENKSFGLTPRKIATFSVPAFETGDHVLTVTVEEEELILKFVSNGQEYTEEELAILSDWYFPTENNADFASIIDTDFTIKATYTELTSISEDDVWGIPFACNKKVGYYKDIAIFNVVNEGLITGFQHGEGTGSYEYSFTIDAFEGANNFNSREIELTFVQDRIGVSQLSLSGENAYSKILTFVDGETEIEKNWASYSWQSDNTNDIKIYLEPYNNVNLSNVEVYIYDTKITLDTDADKGNKKYFTIPAGTLPVDYCESGNIHVADAKEFSIEIKNVDVSNADFITNFTITANNGNVGLGTDARIYYVQNGVSYYFPNQNVSVNCSMGNDVRPNSLTLNGTTFDLGEYVYRNSNVPVGDGIYENPDLQSWRDDTDTFYNYRVTIGEKQVLLNITFNEDGSLSFVHAEFTLSGSTTVEFTF